MKQSGWARYSIKLRRMFLSMRYGFWVPPFDGMMDEPRCRFLYDLVLRHPARSTGIMAEIGVFKGASTAWLARAGRQSGYCRLVAIDLFTGTPSWNESWDTEAEFRLRLRRNRLEEFVEVRRGDSRQTAAVWKQAEGIEFLHVDGDHSAEGACADVESYAPLLTPGGILILDDYDDLHPGVICAGERLQAMGFEIFDRVIRSPLNGGSAAFRRKGLKG